ncbi:MAG: hypothetical protein HPY59_15670 [Anaerolineae bacterium]|nr:hypothetical protein [Anaerolineae bacterium]
MGKDEKKRKLVGPWRSIHGAIWLIGLAILAWKGWWFPGILVLIAVSMILEAALMKFVPQAFEEEQPATPPTTPAASAPFAAAQAPERHPELLPTVCPKCGGPVRAHEVRWTSTRSADCSFCGANLPMRKSEPAI